MILHQNWVEYLALTDAMALISPVIGRAKNEPRCSWLITMMIIMMCLVEVWLFFQLSVLFLFQIIPPGPSLRMALMWKTRLLDCTRLCQARWASRKPLSLCTVDLHASGCMHRKSPLSLKLKNWGSFPPWLSRSFCVCVCGWRIGLLYDWLTGVRVD